MEYRLVDFPPKMAEQYGPGTMLIPRPLDVDALVRKIPRGKLATVRQIREKLATDFNATIACSLSTGIFCGFPPKRPKKTPLPGLNKSRFIGM